MARDSESDCRSPEPSGHLSGELLLNEVSKDRAIGNKVNSEICKGGTAGLAPLEIVERAASSGQKQEPAPKRQEQPDGRSSQLPLPEGIVPSTLEIAQTFHRPKPGETARDICVRAMGPGADSERIERFIKKFLNVNQIKTDDLTVLDEKLLLTIPEHTFYPHRQLTQAQIEDIANNIDKAANRTGFFGLNLMGFGVDQKTLYEQLKLVKTDDERRWLDTAYTKLTGHGIRAELEDELIALGLKRATDIWDGIGKRKPLKASWF